MPDLSVRAKPILLFGNSCKVGEGEFLPDIAIEEALFVTNSCENPFNRNIVTCLSKERDKFINEVGSLQLDLPIKSATLDLPLYFPTLDIQSATLMHKLNPTQFIGMSLRHFTRKLVHCKAGGYREAREITFQPIENFFLFQNQSRIILFLTGTDTGIEYAWRERAKFKLFESIKERNILAVGAFNFSLFDGDCAFSQVLNQKRSLYSSYLLQQNGIPTIPHIYAITQFQLQRWVTWLIQNPEVKLVTINCQFIKTQSQRIDEINIIRKLILAVPYLQIILEGFPFDSIFRLGPAIDNLHFTDKVPMRQASNYKELNVDKIHRKMCIQSTESFPSLLLKNIQRRELQLQLIRQSIFESGLKKTG